MMRARSIRDRPCVKDRGRGADLMGAKLKGADLRNANLRGAYLIAADLRGADLRVADLIGADFRDADLREPIWRPASSLLSSKLTRQKETPLPNCLHPYLDRTIGRVNAEYIG